MLISCFFISNGNTAYTKTVFHDSWLYQFRPETKVSYDNAKAFCAGLGGNLTTPKTDEELEFLRNEMKVIDTEIDTEKFHQSISIQGCPQIYKLVTLSNIHY